jgi:rubrerythrin
VPTGLSRATFLRRGAVGGGALLVSASGFAGLAGSASAATPPDGDLAYLRLLIGAELLSLDFYASALASGKLKHHGAPGLVRRIRAQEKAHYSELSVVLTAAGQTPAVAGDIDFTYPKGSFDSQASIVRLAGRLERLMVGAYLGAIENVATPQLRIPIGQIAASESQHVGALNGLEGRDPIGKPFPLVLPMAAVSDQLDAFEA